MDKISGEIWEMVCKDMDINDIKSYFYQQYPESISEISNDVDDVFKLFYDEHVLCE